ncbi:MAG: hypothetical protein M1834_006567 [Cirrosporium novae-zelandiae]|nr:MAG: hypothetical protein M1834_006567 [Cirrosporium novae-zelandiae]
MSAHIDPNCGLEPTELFKKVDYLPKSQPTAMPEPVTVDGALDGACVSSVSTGSQPSSSPESRPADIHDPIPEEDEGETSSEAVEPLTPTSDGHPHTFEHQLDDAIPTAIAHISAKPLFITTPATPEQSRPPTAVSRPSHTSHPSHSSAPAKVQPTSPTGKSFRRTASNSIKSLFRRSSHNEKDPGGFAWPEDSQSNSAVMDGTHTSNMGYIEPPPPPPPRRTSLSAAISRAFNGSDPTTRRNSQSKSSSNSPDYSNSVSPPSSGSPSSTLDTNWDVPERHRFAGTHHRSATGLSYSRDKDKIRFGEAPRPERGHSRRRTSSMSRLPAYEESSDLKEHISAHAASGVGLKSRRMSLSLPDDFVVDSIELNEEFASSSLLPGRRGKTIGNGATAKVKIMKRKGGSSDELYAVKEFRRKGSHETQAEYEKKVKSEFSIANSLHHPNIVRTVRLCTHNGRWNHVMEYCSVGELYSLVQKRYLTKDDKLCLFKQLLQGVAYLHVHGIAHRDIKPENLLMTSQGHLKITDFGVSEVFCGEHPGLRSSGGVCGKNMKECRRSAPGICGSLPYIAPEVLEKKGDYDPRPLDVWSSAMVFLTMLLNGNPWGEARVEKDTSGNYAAFLAGWKKYIADHPDGLIPMDDPSARLPKCGVLFSRGIESYALRRLVLRMLHPDPDKRITIREALCDRWMKTVECCCLEEEDSKAMIDASAKNGCKSTSKMQVKKLHNHLPPPTKRMPQHRFDMGSGWS